MKVMHEYIIFGEFVPINRDAVPHFSAFLGIHPE
jgi:hypothetical protein